jgi:hypothetical protein
MVEECWRIVNDYPDYEISNSGSILSHRKGTCKLLKLVKNRSQYLQVTMTNAAGYRQIVYVHILVATAFFGARPSMYHVANHKDGNKLNNCVDNLEWITKSQDYRHAYNLGLIPSQRKTHNLQICGSHGNAKLTAAQATEIRANKELTPLQMAIRYSVTRGTIYAVLHKYTWKHLL